MQSADRRIYSFLAIAYGITWSIAGSGYLLGITSVDDMRFVLVAALSMFGPGIAAIVQQRLIDKAPWSGLGLPLKGTHWGIFLATALVGMLLVPVCLMVLHVFGNVAGVDAFGQVSVTSERLVSRLSEMSHDHGEGVSDQIGLLGKVPGGVVLLGMLLAALLASVTINLPFMLGEELGWRGYLYQRTAQWSGMHRVYFTGVVWGLWHAPLVLMGHNYPGQGLFGVVMMVAFCTLLAFLFDWTRSRSNSIWSSCVLHGLINGSAGAMAMFTWGGHILIGTVVGVAGFITISILVAAVLLFDRDYRRMLMYPNGVENAIAASPGSADPRN